MKIVKTKKIVVSLACLLLCVCMAFFSCGLLKGTDKEFSAAGMTITLTSAFAEQDIVSQTAYYVSLSSIVTALKEDFTLYNAAGIGDKTLTEYAQLVITANSLTAAVEEKDGLTYFTYEKTLNSKDYKYLACVFKATDAYWLIQFACEKDNYDKNEAQFKKWAKTVTFTEDTSTGGVTTVAVDDSKTFTVSGMTVTLNDTFTQKSNVSFAAYFESTQYVVFATKEANSTLTAAGLSADMTLAEYAQIVISNNSLSSTVTEKNGMTCFTYSASASGVNFKYLAFVFKTADAYWMVQFAATDAMYASAEPLFLKWAASITFAG